MSLLGIRDAALESKFQSRDAFFGWLNRAVGDPLRHLTAALRHCRQSLALCPLQGHGYIYLAELSFLEGSRGPSTRDCIRQALQLRPYDADVAYAAASEALLAGDVSQWLVLAKRSYRRGYRRQIIGDLVGRTPPEQIQETIDFIDEHFQPDCYGLQILYEACAKRCPPERLVPLCQTRAQRAELEAAKLDGLPAARLWLSAQFLYADLGDGPRALACARMAMQHDPSDYIVHLQLSLRLLEQKLYAEAESELDWCRQRKPGEKSLEYRAKEIIKARLSAERNEADSAKRF